MNAPGSPSSALQTTYFWSALFAAAKLLLVPVGKPPPPRPRMPDFLISSMMPAGVFAETALASAS
jgi:hypothetical protein